MRIDSRYNEPVIDACKMEILNRVHGFLTNVDDSPCPGLEERIDDLKNFLKAVAENRESNSLLIVGPRGSGKSKLVNFALRKLAEEAPEAVPAKVIRLNGWIHTDDRKALLEIFRQFNVSEENGLEILNSPSSFVDCMQWLHSTFSAGASHSQSSSICIILEEFDLFSMHPKQTLLYNLFDLAAAKCHEHPLAIIGETCRWDAIELLEKRVRSRFSNRQLSLNLPENFVQFSAVILHILRLPDAFHPSDFASEYNSSLEALFASSSFVNFLKGFHIMHNDFRAFFVAFMPLIYGLTVENPFFSEAAILQSFRTQSRDYWRDLIHGFTYLQISLLISIKNLVECDTLTFNFELVYREYKNLFSRTHSEVIEKAPKALALKAFESLFKMELIKFSTTVNANIPIDCRPTKLCLPLGILSSALKSAPDLPLYIQSVIH